MKPETFQPVVLQSLADTAEFALSGSAQVPSPCQSICVMDKASGWCTGCLRNISEIAAWGGLPDEPRRQIWAHIQRRAAKLLQTA
jgi:predicted Fe-S protein YdhL (DUF1289 family)